MPSLPWRSPRRCYLEEPAPLDGSRRHRTVLWCSPTQEREGEEKVDPREREGEEILRDFALDVCAASSRRWLEKRRRAGIAVVRPQFSLMRLRGRPDLAKKAVPTEGSRCWMDMIDGRERREWVDMRDGRRYFGREWVDTRVFHPCAQLLQNFRACMNNSTSCLFLVPAVLNNSRHKK
jgi:hypothetical protein